MDVELAVADEHRDLVRGDGGHERLAVAGARHRADAVLGERAGAGQRGVADAAGPLALHAAGRRRGGDVARRCRPRPRRRSRPPRSASPRRRGGAARRPGRPGPGRRPPCPSARLEPLVVDALEAVLVGQALGALADQQHVRACGRAPARASATGWRMPRTQAIAPARRPTPSMTHASSSTLPSAVATAPRPALKRGASSSTSTAACTASSALPPRSRTAPPARSAARAICVDLLLALAAPERRPRRGSR